jgi:preprotein translocase subunit SecF
MHIIPYGTKIDFLSKTKIAFFISLCCIAYSIFYFVNLGDAKYGIDFSGGHELVVKAEGKSSDDIRAALHKAGIENAVVQSFEVGSEQYSVRLGSEIGDAKVVKTKFEQALKDAGLNDVSIIKTDFVGPTVGHELKLHATIALIAGLFVILLYIAFRFEFSFALGAVVALFHDTIICFGVYLLAGFTLSMGAVAAALTIIGYSVNDTIIIFDRVREEVKKKKNYNLSDVMNESINLTLDRSIVTHLLTLFSALALLLIGGGSIADLSVFLVVGIITGTYSTIYIACPVTVMWENFRSKKSK